jgi:hypothetical protein
MDLLGVYTHDSELQVITALRLISTFYKLLLQTLSFPQPQCLQQLIPGNGFHQWRFFSFPRSGPSCPANVSHLKSLNSLRKSKSKSKLKSKSKSKSKLYYDRQSVGQCVLVSSTHLGLKTRFCFLSDSCEFVDVGRPL